MGVAVEGVKNRQELRHLTWNLNLRPCINESSVKPLDHLLAEDAGDLVGVAVEGEQQTGSETFDMEFEPMTLVSRVKRQTTGPLTC